MSKEIENSICVIQRDYKNIERRLFNLDEHIQLLHNHLDIISVCSSNKKVMKEEGYEFFGVLDGNCCSGPEEFWIKPKDKENKNG